MSRFFNKGLIYQWFNSAKAALALGIIAWGIVASHMIKETLNMVKIDISNNFINSYKMEGLEQYAVLGVIFLMIHFISQGINKRNSAMFLLSSPYTKKEIKYNELICFLITLAIFIAEYLYIAVMKYVQHRELISIIDGYFSIIGIEMIRILLFGVIGIIMMLIIDFMFSNSLAGLISMVSLLPISLLLIVAKIEDILRYIDISNGKNIFDLIYSHNKDVSADRYSIILLDSLHRNDIRMKYLVIEIIITLFIIGVLVVIYNSMQKKYKIELSNRIFTSKKNEKIVINIISLGAGSFMSLIFVSEYIERMKENISYSIYVLSGMNLVQALAMDIGCILIVALICSKLIKKILKVVE